jgi:hypothetical protein
MIAAALYLIVITGLLLHKRFFGLFRDNHLDKKTLAGFFLLKALAVPAFYLVYERYYGGLEFFDSGKFYHDVQVIHAYAFKNTMGFIRLMLGLQDEDPSSEIYRHCLANTLNWDNGTKDFFYNDNRILIRLHVLLHFIAFRSWFVHALFSCFFSFAGLFMLYKSFRNCFKDREKWLFALLCFFPALWFYTGGFLKEGFTVFIMGCTVHAIRQALHFGISMRSLWLVPLLLLSFLLKPYLLLLSACCFGVFFLLNNKKPRYRPLIFLSVIALAVLLLNFATIALKGRSLGEAALKQQRVFSGMAKGGIFLAHEDIYLRLDYDSSLVKRINDSVYTIREGVPYAYWEDTHHEDTLYNYGNTDTLTQYRLQFMTPQAGSNLQTRPYSDPVAMHILQAFYNSLFRPFFYNAKNAIAMVVSLENLLLSLSILICLFGFIRNKKDPFPPLVFLFFALSVCLLVGFTSPNTGAIFRYRAPAVIFILMSALYYLPARKRGKRI